MHAAGVYIYLSIYVYISSTSWCVLAYKELASSYVLVFYVNDVMSATYCWIISRLTNR